MNIEKKLQDFILTKYDSINQFCQESGISSSTIFTVFKRGISSTSTTTIIRICQALSINAQALYDGQIKEIESDSEVISLYQLLENLENKNVIYKGKFLTTEQKRVIAYASKIALLTLLHEQGEEENGDGNEQ